MLAGGLVFLSKFGVMGANDSPFLAVGFGLFVIGMVVFCASLIALIGTGVSVLAERRGWPPAAIAIFAPLALVWALYSLGAVGYAIPAVLLARVDRRARRRAEVGACAGWPRARRALRQSGAAEGS